MAKGLRDILVEQMRNLGLSPSLIRRLVPSRGRSWNRLSDDLEGLIALIVYRVRVELEMGANIRTRLLRNAINAVRGGEEIPDSDTLDNLTCSSSEEELIEARVRKSVRPSPKQKSSTSSSNGVRTRGQKRKASEVIILDDICSSGSKKHRKRGPGPDDDDQRPSCSVNLVSRPVRV